ncbi:MAG: hypothetical protein FWE37_04640 [Spirochaetaceae bacterium]|nr:hypothetical protein [Spirochaetaceae bacterium]
MKKILLTLLTALSLTLIACSSPPTLHYEVSAVYADSHAPVDSSTQFRVFFFTAVGEQNIQSGMPFNHSFTIHEDTMGFITVNRLPADNTDYIFTVTIRRNGRIVTSNRHIGSGSFAGPVAVNRW